ncbi:hypothetical protein BpHYR1_011176, partial [Brachionus plicatilis]
MSNERIDEKPKSRVKEL